MKNLTLLLIIFIFSISFSQVGIGTTLPNPSSALDISSNSQGFLMPRMTQTQRNAIVAPANGLFIYNLDFSCFQFYNGVSWSKCLGEVQSNRLDCASVSTTGTTIVGVPISVGNTIKINVLVNVIDNYTFTTNTSNGYSFSASGIYPTIGINTITLVGTGTPIVTQTDNFTITNVQTGLTCAISNTVINQLTRNCLDYKNGGYNIDGIYLIDPDGVGGNQAFNCYCDMTNNGGGWTLVFNHDIAGGYWLNDAEADQFNIASPELTTSKYSILYKIDDLRSVATKYEFRLFYPSLNKTNHWSQTFNPRSGGSFTTPVAGYTAISIGMTANGWGGLENNNENTYLDGTVYDGNWWYSIGSKASFPGMPAESSSTDKVQLYIR